MQVSGLNFDLCISRRTDHLILMRLSGSVCQAHTRLGVFLAPSCRDSVTMLFRCFTQLFRIVVQEMSVFSSFSIVGILLLINAIVVDFRLLMMIILIIELHVHHFSPHE